LKEIEVSVLIDLTGRTALVTGAGRSVGRGIAEVLASAGAFVYVNDLHADRAAETVAAIRSNGDNCSTAIFDITDAASVDEGFGAISGDARGVDILVNNAGIAEGISTSLFSQSGPEDWFPTMNLNVFGTMNVVRRSLPGMIEMGWGRIIQISSGAGSIGLPIGVSSYGASKAAAESLMRHVAVENAKHGITANALALGLMANMADVASEQLTRMLATVPVRRLGTPEEVGLAAAWLSSEGGGFVTGQVIHLNGGAAFGR
jgi:NAD(P)-dependent dehydrogenase (short-subunit alcohol dehydrogenase family)